MELAGMIKIGVEVDVDAGKRGLAELEKSAQQAEQRVSGSFNRMLDAANRAEDAAGGFGRRTEDAAKQAVAANDNIARSGQRVEAIYGRMRLAVAAFGAAAAAAFSAGVVGAIRRLREVETVNAQVNKALENAGTMAGHSAESIRRWADDLERSTGRAATEVMAISANLASFGFNEDVFFRAIQLADDMAAAWGGDLRQNMEGLARALENPEKGLAMLSARGITFSAEGRQLAMRLSEIGDSAGAAAVLMDELESQVAGVAEAGFTGLTRASAEARRSMSTFFETVVSKSGSMTALEASLNGVAGSFEILNKNADLVLLGLGVLTARIAGPYVAANMAAAAAAAAHATALLSGNAVMINSRKAAEMRTAAIAQSALADQLAKQMALEVAQAELVRARNIYAAAQAGQIAGVTQVQAHQNMIAASRNVTAAQTALAASSVRATTAVTAQTAAMRANTIAARAMAVAATAASSAMAMVGGPAGAAILALGGAWYIASQRAQEARERSDRYAEIIRKAGENSAAAGMGIREAAAAFYEVADAATAAERAVTLASTQADLRKHWSDLRLELAKLSTELRLEGVSFDVYHSIMRQTSLMTDEFKAGRLPVESYIKEIDKISSTYPDASPIIAEIQKIARNAAAALGVLDAMNQAAAEIGQTAIAPKGDRPGASPMDMAAEDARQALLFRERFGGWEGMFPEIFREQERRMKDAAREAERLAKQAEREAERLAKAYQNIVDSAQDFIRSQELEASVIGMSEQAANALRYEWEMLNDARRAGLTLTDADRHGFKALAEAMAEAEAQTKRLTERFEFMKDLTRGIFSDIKNSLISNMQQGMSFWDAAWDAMGKAAINALNKVVDKILDDLIDAIYEAIRASMAGGGGGILGMVGKMLGLAGGGGVGFGNPNYFPPAPGGIGSSGGLYQSGGHTGTGRDDQIAGLVHANEYVFSADAVRRLGIGYLDQLHRAARGGGSIGDNVSRLYSGANDNFNFSAFDHATRAAEHLARAMNFATSNAAIFGQHAGFMAKAFEMARGGGMQEGMQWWRTGSRNGHLPPMQSRPAFQGNAAVAQPEPLKIELVSRFDADGGFETAVERSSRPVAKVESARTTQAGFDQYDRNQRRGGLASNQTSFQMLKRR